MTFLRRVVLAASLAVGCGGASPSAEAPGQLEASTPAARIWSISVGVSKYRQADISLEFAHRDAAEIDAFFASPAGGSVPADRRVLLVDEHATRSAALTALNDVARRAAPEDMVVIFLAMHGIPDGGGDLYFLTHDTDPKALVGTGLPQRDVEYVLRRAQARRVVLIADACHAGAAGLGSFRNSRGLELAETNRLVAALAESKPGTAVLMATSATESSVEAARWGGGHGVFTHFVLTGLRGEADADANRVVTVRELYDFVYRRVSEDTRGAQHPELTGRFDNRMPLALVGAWARPAVSPRPAIPPPPIATAALPAPGASPAPVVVAPPSQPPVVTPAPAPSAPPSGPPPKPPPETADQIIERERDPRPWWRSPRPLQRLESELQYVTALLPKLRRDDPDRRVKIAELAVYHLEMSAHGHAGAIDPALSADDRAKARKKEIDHRRAVVTMLLLFRQDYLDQYCDGRLWFSSCDADTSYYLGVEYERLGEIATARRWYTQTLSSRVYDENDTLGRLARFALAELLLREAGGDRARLGEIEKAYLAVSGSDIIRRGHSYRMDTASHYRLAKMYEAHGDRVLAKNHYRKFTAGTAFMPFIPDWAK